jgi:hypothetical protein
MRKKKRNLQKKKRWLQKEAVTKKSDHKKKQKEKPCNLRSSSRIDLNIFMKRI